MRLIVEVILSTFLKICAFLELEKFLVFVQVLITQPIIKLCKDLPEEPELEMSLLHVLQ